jgi:hypothetical protein
VQHRAACRAGVALADGTRQYLQISGEQMFDAASRFIGYRGIGMDVTERMGRDKK